MLTPLRLSLALFGLALAAAPLLARGEEHLLILVRAVRAAEGKAAIGALLDGLADLPEVDAPGDALRAALAAGGVPSTPVSARFLGGIARLARRGAELRVDYARPAQHEVVIDGKPKGWVTLERVVRFEVVRRRGAVALTGISGIRLSREADGFKVRLKEVVVERRQGRTIARVTAGLTWPLERTVTVDLSDPRTAADGVEREGMAGALR